MHLSRSFPNVAARLCYSLLLVLGGMSYLFAQDKKPANNAIFLEGATRGPVYSINYDRMIHRGATMAQSIRGGISIYGNKVGFPVGLSFITGQSAHHCDFGLTVIPFIDYNAHLIGSNDYDADKFIFVNPFFGYRYQKKTNGVFLKASAGPSLFLDPPSNDFWNMDPRWYAFASIAIGVSF